MWETCLLVVSAVFLLDFLQPPPPHTLLPLAPFSHLSSMRRLWHHIKCSTALWKTWKGGKEVEEITAVNDDTPLASSPCPPVSHGGASEWQSIKRKSTKPWLTRLCTQRSPNLHLAISCKPHPGSLGDSTMLTVTSLLVWLCVCVFVCMRAREWGCDCVCVCVRARVKANRKGKSICGILVGSSF